MNYYRGRLFGLSEEQSKSSISGLCRNMLLKAESRRHGKTIIYIKEDDNHLYDDHSSSESCKDSVSSENEECPRKKIKNWFNWFN